MQIYEVTDPLFKEYGKIIDSVELTELLAEMKHTPVPEDVYGRVHNARLSHTALPPSRQEPGRL